jgi:Mrp family chromosome partitioning ATPase
MSGGTKCEGCASKTCAAAGRREGEGEEAFRERQALAARLCRIRHKVLVLSGKGGVGKSSVAVNLAAAFRLAGKTVGLLDADFHGPSVPRLLGLREHAIPSEGDTIVPPERDGIKAMSVGFFLPKRDDAVIWRGPVKIAALRQFLREVEWGDLDVLVADCPPGTGDEPLSLAQSIPEPDGAVVVTTPQDLALENVRRSVTFCRRLRLPVLGVVENLSGFACPHCGTVTEIFGAGGGEAMAADMGVPFLGRVPIDPEMVKAGDAGRPFVLERPDAPASGALRAIAARLLEGFVAGEKDAGAGPRASS